MPRFNVRFLPPKRIQGERVHVRPSTPLLSLSLFISGAAKAGGVRFSEEPSAAGAASHVHFDEKLHDSVVMVTPEDDGNFMVKVC